MNDTLAEDEVVQEDTDSEGLFLSYDLVNDELCRESTFEPEPCFGYVDYLEYSLRSINLPPGIGLLNLLVY